MTTDPPTHETHEAPAGTRSRVILALAWLAVGLPLLWGVLQTFTKALSLFE
jgi:hypothetical protein